MQIGSRSQWPANYPDEHPPSVGAQRGIDRPASTAVGMRPAPAGQRRDDIIAEASGSGRIDPSERPPEEQSQIEELKRRDQEVRRHEAAHMAAGGAYVRGGPAYAKMQVVRRAALAPARPSGQDLSVAARSAQVEMRARAQLAEQTRVAGRDAVSNDRGAATEAATEPRAAAPLVSESVGSTADSTGSLLDTYA